MAGLSASGLKTQIRSYTETDSNVLSDSVLENIILNAQYRIFRDVPIDADRKTSTGNFTSGTGTVTVPAGAVFIRAVQVYTATGSTANRLRFKVENQTLAAGQTLSLGTALHDAVTLPSGVTIKDTASGTVNSQRNLAASVRVTHTVAA